MATHRTLDEVWDNIVATLELGSGLKFAFVEAENGQDRTNLRRRLQRYLKTQGKSLRMPLPQQDVLDWLSSEQTPPGVGEPPEETRWVVLPRTGKERFVLHRLNEGRDNLRRHMGGMLFLVGSRDAPFPPLHRSEDATVAAALQVWHVTPHRRHISSPLQSGEFRPS